MNPNHLREFKHIEDMICGLDNNNSPSTLSYGEK